MLGLLSEGKGGEHAERLRRRNHYREIHCTPECPEPADLEKLSEIERVMSDFIVAKEEAGKSWYKVDQTDIPVVSDSETATVMPLSRLSPIVGSLRATRRVSLYATPEKAKEARTKIAGLLRAVAT